VRDLPLIAGATAATSPKALARSPVAAPSAPVALRPVAGEKVSQLFPAPLPIPPLIDVRQLYNFNVLAVSSS